MKYCHSECVAVTLVVQTAGNEFQIKKDFLWIIIEILFKQVTPYNFKTGLKIS